MRITRFKILACERSKVISKQIGKFSERLSDRLPALFNSIAPKGWSEGVDVSRFRKFFSNPLLLIYLTAFLSVGILVLLVLPYALLVDPLTAEIVTAVLGFISVVSLSSIVAPLGVLLVCFLALRITRVITWRIDIKSILVHLSNYIGVGGVIGSLSASMAPLVFSLARPTNEFSSSIMFDGSVLLKLPASFGVAGLLLGLCTASCHAVKGIENVFYKSVMPVLLFDILATIFALELHVDPFSLCAKLSERYLLDNSLLVSQMDSISDASAPGFVRDHLPLVAARAFTTLDLNTTSVRIWYVGAVIVVSTIGMSWNIRKSAHVKRDAGHTVKSVFTENEAGRKC